MPIRKAGQVHFLALALTVGASSCGPESPADDTATSLAVLPFRNLSADPSESDYVAEGIAQAVITRLTQAGLRVTPWETARRYRDHEETLEDLARELHVERVLVGTFQLSSERIFTTLSLVDAQTGFQTWAAELDEPFQELFTVQRRIAQGAAESLKRELTGGEVEILATDATDNLEAYDHYLQGAHFLLDGDRESTSIARQYFTRAVELDPNLVEAHVGLGASISAGFHFWWGDGYSDLELAQASFERALELDPGSSPARRGLIRLHFFRGASEKSLELAADAADTDDDIEALFTRAEGYLFGGLPDRATPRFERILALDPENYSAQWHAFFTYAFSERYREAIDTGEAFLAQFGSDNSIQLHTGLMHHALGELDEALAYYQMGAGDEPDGIDYTGVIRAFYSGILLEQMGQEEKAQQVFRDAIASLTPLRDATPTNFRLHIALASFHGALGEREAFRRAEAAAFAPYESGQSPAPILLALLASVHSRLGDDERAAELLRGALDRGRVVMMERTYLKLAGVSLDEPPFDTFRAELEREVGRLRERY